jgi:hypothetical protein
MGLLEQARQDIKQVTTDKDSGFAVDITLTAPDNTTVTVQGLHTKHHMALDEQGQRVNSKNASISIAEDLLADYPVRGGDGEVYMQGHLAAVKDSTGTICHYMVRQWFPDETLGLLVLILSDYE